MLTWCIRYPSVTEESCLYAGGTYMLYIQVDNPMLTRNECVIWFSVDGNCQDSDEIVLKS